MITGEFAFLSGENKARTTKRLLEYAKAKDTNDKTRHTFYQCYKELAGFKETVKQLNVPPLAAKVLGGTVAGPLKVKTLSKKYRKMQKLNKKFLKLEATGKALPAILEELIHQEEIEAKKEAQATGPEKAQPQKMIAATEARKPAEPQPRKAAEETKAVPAPKTTAEIEEKMAAKKRAQDENKAPGPQKKPKAEDTVLEVMEPAAVVKKKKLKKKQQQQKEKKGEEKKKVKFDLSANTTKSMP